jgi:hypothetical protein
MTPKQVSKKREALIKRLRTNPTTTVTFTKVDGSKRVMNCTLMEGHIPVMESTSERKENKDVVVVFDLDKGQWRSFRVDSVQSTTK